MLPNFSNLHAATSNPNDTTPVPVPPELPELPDEIVQMILLLDKNIQYSIENAERVIRQKFYTQDGKQAIELLCNSVQMLINYMQIVRPEYRGAFQAKLVEVTHQLERFVNHVEGWVKSSPEFETVIAMCANLKELFARSAAKPLPPPLSRMRATGMHQSGVTKYLLDLQYDVWASYQLYFNQCYESQNGKGYRPESSNVESAINKLMDAGSVIRTTGDKTVILHPEVLQAWQIFCEEVALPFFRSVLPKGAELSYMERVSDPEQFKHMSHKELEKVLGELSAAHTMCILKPKPNPAVNYNEDDLRPPRS